MPRFNCFELIIGFVNGEAELSSVGAKRRQAARLRKTLSGTTLLISQNNGFPIQSRRESRLHFAAFNS
jgi:hypothetical protein